MTRFAALLLLTACSMEPAGYAAQPLTVEQADGGADELTLASGSRLYLETTASSDPVLALRWEDTAAAGYLKIGEGQAGPDYEALEHLAFDADFQHSWMLDGALAWKLQDHPMAGHLIHYSDVASVWFGNTLRRPADLSYQGGSLGGAAAGESLTIRGQGMNGTSTATSVTGGDLRLLAGDASSVPSISVPLDPGEVLLRGGRVGLTTRGNVALHAEPSTWCAMEGGLYVHDAATVPTSSPTGGGFLYADGGALYWRGSAGTVTQVAPP